MTGELRSTMDYNNPSKSVLDSIERVVPHHANKPMILKLLEGSGLKPELFYFNIDRMGNTSSASIPIALFDAVKDKEIVKRTKVFAPGFGAGAVGGYVVMNFDPKIVRHTAPIYFKKAG